MPKVKYDVRDAEVRSFETPKPGVYTAHIHEMSYGKSSNNNNMFTIVFEIRDGEYKGSRIWHYVLTSDEHAWRLRELTDALGLPARGEIDPDKLTGSVVQIRTVIDPAKDGYDEKARIKNVMATKDRNGGAPSEEDEAPYSEWETSELREEVNERGIAIGGRVTKKKLIDALEEDDGGDNKDSAEEDDEEEDDDETKAEADDDEYLSREDLDEMSRTELKSLIKDESLEIKVLKKHSDDDLRNMIGEVLELTESDSAEEEDDDEEADADTAEEDAEDYSDWSMDDLKNELKERGLKPEGRKSVLVKRLQQDDASGDDPF